jgi:hypothetical protein
MLAELRQEIGNYEKRSHSLSEKVKDFFALRHLPTEAIWSERLCQLEVAMIMAKDKGDKISFVKTAVEDILG